MPYVVNQGVRIFYEVEGTGTPLFLHHGLRHWGAFWRDDGYTASLRKSYQLILLDARGHGASDKPHDPACYTAEAMVKDVLCVLDDLEIRKAHFWGYSLGGMVGAHMLRYAPQYLQSLIIGGMAPYSPRDIIPDEWTHVRSIQMYAVEHGMEAFVAREFEGGGPRIPEPARSRLVANDPVALLACVDGAFEWPGAGDSWRNTVNPCLMYAGELDPWYPSAKQAALERPDVAFVSLPDLDHLGVLFSPDLVLTHTAKFLASVSCERKD